LVKKVVVNLYIVDMDC